VPVFASLNQTARRTATKMPGHCCAQLTPPVAVWTIVPM
jgi:hypothetical protein